MRYSDLLAMADRHCIFKQCIKKPTEEKRQRRLVHIPIGRFGEVKEIAQAALFLASGESSYMPGATFLVDGGITAAYVTPD